MQGKENTMNWDRMEGQWKQGRGKAVAHWGKVMNDELAAVAGRYEELVGKLQERYGMAREEAKMQGIKCSQISARLKKSDRELVRLRKRLHQRTSVLTPKKGSRPSGNGKRSGKR
jgi:uncharacterized protein YjbJ (UPF0337 family)